MVGSQQVTRAVTLNRGVGVGQAFRKAKKTMDDGEDDDDGEDEDAATMTGGDSATQEPVLR
jgi:hypothetical protein